jgi:hypothetical protein
MPEITLEAVEARQAELATMIETLKRASKSSTAAIAAAQIVLRPGERYVGPVLNDDGNVAYHLIKLPDSPSQALSHDEAVKWAKQVGGKLPNKREMRLIQANASDAIPSSGWCWLEDPEGSSYAWYCSLGYGIVYYDIRSAAGGAVAVRLIAVEA